jgi:hypothetical protein
MGAQFVPNVQGSEIDLGAPMELLGHVGHVKARFDTFGGSVNLSPRLVHGCTECTTGKEIFLATPNGPPRWCGVKWNLILVLSEIVFILTQDRRKIGAWFAPNVQ